MNIDRYGTSPDEVLASAVDRLIAACRVCTPSNTYLSTLPNELPPSADEFMFEVSMTSGQGDDGSNTGGGVLLPTTRGVLTVAIHSTVQLDKSGQDTEFLTHRSRGIIGKATAVFSCLVGHDLQSREGVLLLTEELRYHSWEIPPKNQRERGSFLCHLECCYVWNLDIPPDSLEDLDL